MPPIPRAFAWLSLALTLSACGTPDTKDVFSNAAPPSSDQGPVPWTPDAGDPSESCGNQCSERAPSACTCDPSDPCGWVGDGICDAVCSSVLPNGHLDDTDDCAADPGTSTGTPSSPDACEGECNNGWLTPCTCSSSDPCGWRGDGECDAECAQVVPDGLDDSEDCADTGTGGNGEPGMCALAIPGGTGQEPGGQIPVCCAPPNEERAAIDQVFALLNEHRQSRGRAPLTYDPTLESAIQGHCMHMEQHDFFSHDAPESAVGSPWDRASLCGAQAHGENIAWGYETAEDVMTGWKWSPGHNANMLNGSFTRVGIGKYGDMWGQLFGM